MKILSNDKNNLPKDKHNLVKILRNLEGRYVCDFDDCCKSFVRGNRLIKHKKAKHYHEDLH